MEQTRAIIYANETLSDCSTFKYHSKFNRIAIDREQKNLFCEILIESTKHEPNAEVTIQRK